MQTFYEAERKHSNILMEDGKPVGGQFSFDQENRKRLPKSISIPKLPLIEETKHHKTVCKTIKELFPDHPRIKLHSLRM